MRYIDNAYYVRLCEGAEYLRALQCAKAKHMKIFLCMRHFDCISLFMRAFFFVLLH